VTAARSTGNRFLLGLHVVLYVVVPSFLMFWSTTIDEAVACAPSWILGSARLALFFVVLPVHIIYLAIAINAWFPRRTPRALLAFVPFVVTVVTYVTAYGFDRGYFAVWLLNALPLFVGFQLCLVGGTTMLFLEKLDEADDKGAKIAVFAFLFFLFFLPVAVVTYCGGRLHVVWAPDGREALKSCLIFACSILLVVGFHRRVLAKLYEQGEL